MKLDEQTREEASRWFAALRRGPMSLDERQAFDKWRTDPLHQAALNSMHELWGEAAGIGQFGVKIPRRISWPRSAAAAAGIIAVLGSVTLYFANPTAAPEAAHRIATAVGEQRTTTLTDGSVISANVVTRLAYNVGGRRRAVTLDQGEAAFFVHKDRTRPFVVTAGGYEVEAVGTAFNVRNRNGEIDVAVMEGVVSVRAADGPMAGREIRRLGAGRRIALGPIQELGQTPIKVATIAPQSGAEWRTRTLAYDDVPVSAVVSDLNLYFKRPIVVEDAALDNRHVTLRLQVDDREQAVSTLAGLLGARVQPGPNADTLTD
jgi:transmembrane sensor